MTGEAAGVAGPARGARAAVRPPATRPVPAPRLLYVVTHGMSALHLLKGQLRWMREAGFEVAVAASPGPDLQAVAEREGVTVFAIPMRREIHPLADLRSLAALTRLLRRWRPQVVNAGTPKAGLLGMMAARLAGTPVRVYTLRGLRLETARGRTRALLALTERMASACAHSVVSVSESLRAAYCAMGLADPAKVVTLGAGSSNGVDAARFALRTPADGQRLRASLGIAADAPVVGFVGRFTRDKGIGELLAAFEAVSAQVPGARLLLVGDFEAGDPVPEAVARRLGEHPGVVRSGFVADTAPYFGAMDVLAFPSLREGFPNVPLEAAAAGLPVVAVRATGSVDAVVDGETGALVEPGDAAALAGALARYLRDPALRRRHGAAGQARVRERFAPERVWSGLLDHYRGLLAAVRT